MVSQSGSQAGIAGPTTLAHRVKALVDEWHGGSIRSASGHLGIPNATLHRIVEGKVTNPRADALQKIAQGYRVTLDWLLSGEGESPSINPAEMHFPREAARRWDLLLRSLDLPWEIMHELWGLPNRFGEQIMVLPFDLRREDRSVIGRFKKAREHGYLAWVTFLSAAIEGWGRDHVREQLSRPEMVAWLKAQHDRSSDRLLVEAQPEGVVFLPENPPPLRAKAEAKGSRRHRKQ
jgi:transcriptional regulator with XRE-family HTH domain